MASWLLLHVPMPSTEQLASPKPYANIYEFKSLLLVDDDRQLAETLQWILASENFLVDVVHDGSEAMAKVSTTLYDAIVCDILMPDERRRFLPPGHRDTAEYKEPLHLHGPAQQRQSAASRRRREVPRQTLPRQETDRLRQSCLPRRP